jgi:hypothetical protein
MRTFFAMATIVVLTTNPAAAKSDMYYQYVASGCSLDVAKGGRICVNGVFYLNWCLAYAKLPLPSPDGGLLECGEDSASKLVAAYRC